VMLQICGASSWPVCRATVASRGKSRKVHDGVCENVKVITAVSLTACHCDVISLISDIKVTGLSIWCAAKSTVVRFSGNISPTTDNFSIKFYTPIVVSYLCKITKFYSIISTFDKFIPY